MSSRRTWIRLALVLGLLPLALGLGELGLALFAPVEFHRPLVDSSDSFDRMHRAGSVPDLEYELVPEIALEVRRWKTTVHTNRFGMRGPDIEREKPTGVFRVAVLGDSFTFGYGLADGDDMPSKLQAELDSRLPGRRFEVLNFGVAGYSSRDEEIVLRHKVPAFDPDLLVLCYVLNDPDAHPNHSVHRLYHHPGVWERFHVTRRFAEFQEQRAIAAAGGWFEYLHRTPRLWNTVVEAFDGIRATAQSLGVPVVLVLMPLLSMGSWEKYTLAPLHEQVAALGVQDGFHVLDLRIPLATRVKSPNDLRLAEGHATPAGNTLFAESLFEYLAQTFPESF